MRVISMQRRGRPARPRPEAMEPRTLLATFTVSSLADAGPGSLREAIERANLDPDLDTIAFAPELAGTIELQSALPDLSTSMILAGPGDSELTVERSPDEGTPSFRIFTVTAETEPGVTIRGLTLRGGSVDGEGGGIRNSGTLTIERTTLTQNETRRMTQEQASLGGAIANFGELTLRNSTIEANVSLGRLIDTFSWLRGSGGGVYNAGSLTIQETAIRGNRSSFGPGGGITNDGEMFISKSLVEENSGSGGSLPRVGVSGPGGGILNTGKITISDSTLRHNRTTSDPLDPRGGGAIFNSGTISIANSTLHGNSATTHGGAIFNSGTISIANSTLSENSTRYGPNEFGRGGAIWNTGNLSATYTTLNDNSSIEGGGIFNEGTLAVTASIFKNPSGGNLAGMGIVNSGGHNLFSNSPDLPLNPTDLVDTDPRLGPLADNGGPTMTHALLPGSPAIDAAATIEGAAVDQRGVPRPQGSAPDIGAFESRGFALTVAGGDGQGARVGTTFPDPLVVAVSSPFGEPVAGGRVTFVAPMTGASAELSGSPALIDADGRGSVVATANAGTGTYTVTAQAAGADVASFTLANQALDQPRVISFRRFGYHAQPTRLVVSFDTAMDPTRAMDVANYLLVSAGRDRRFGTADDRVIPIDVATYDEALRSVSLSPRWRLPLHGSYRLTVVGRPPGGLMSASGVPLDGAGTGQPGSDFEATFGREILVRPEGTASASARAERLAEMRRRQAEHREAHLEQHRQRLAERRAAWEARRASRSGQAATEGRSPLG